MQSATSRCRALAIILLLNLAFLGGCATNNPRDPLEPMNRAVYSFNDGVDRAIIKPVAEGYRAVLPQFVRTGISNIFSNINDVLVALNNLLQGKVVDAVSDVGRVLVNTTIGVAGVFDVATHFGLEKHNEDFGQTLGRWGVGSGPYLVLPFIGPSNVRDGLARLVDFRTDPITYVRSMKLRNSLWGTRALSDRANLLDASKLLETASLDPYEFVRDAYFQRRRNLIYDGAPPRDKDDGAEIAAPAMALVDPAVSRPVSEAITTVTELAQCEAPAAEALDKAAADFVVTQAHELAAAGAEVEPPAAEEQAAAVDADSEQRADATPAVQRIVRVWAAAQ